MNYNVDGYKNFKSGVKNGTPEEVFQYASNIMNRDNKLKGEYNIHDVIQANVDKDTKKAKHFMRGIQSSKKYGKEIAEDNFDLVDPNSDELMTVIHGGTLERINAFTKRGSGSYRAETDMLDKRGKASNRGFQFHSESQSRAADYADKTDGATTSGVLVAQVPKKYMYFNTNGNYDEYMLPAQHWNKLQNVRVISQNSLDWKPGNFYTDAEKSQVRKWDGGKK